MTSRPVPPPVVLPPRRARVGGVEVARPLPQRGRRTVGHWCFVDLFTSGVGTDPTAAMGVGPHPHCGLQTLTWLTSGSLHHTDSLGSSQRIEPGALNLMSAGAGITHAEATVDHSDPVQGAQLWLAQPAHHRHDPPRFAHHTDLPTPQVGEGVEAVVVVGTLDAATSPAAVDADALCVTLATTDGGVATVGLASTREHAVVVLDGEATLHGGWSDGGIPLGPGSMAVLDPGHLELALDLGPRTTALLLGGEPMAETLVMWWNFVVRTPAEAYEAATAWNRGDERFGPSPPSPDPRATAPIPPEPAPPPPPPPS